MKVSIVGQGYVGLPLAIAAAIVGGHSVVGIDTNRKIVETLKNQKSPIRDIADSQIEVAWKSNHYQVADNFDSVQDSDVVIICVPTPLDASQRPDLTYLEAAVESVASNLKSGALVVLESTVSPGTTRNVVAKKLDKNGIHYELAYSPERIDPANKKWNVINTPKLVAGISVKATKQALNFYKTFIEEVILGSSVEVIETAKLLENSFRLINISFINEIAEFCSKLEIDVREVIGAAATKPYGFMPFYPGAGVGGHCIPVDPSYLSSRAKEIGAGTRFIDLANDVNRSLPAYFAGVASRILGALKGKTIVLVGIAYKSDVSDMRETPASGLIRELRSAGAKVFWHDELVGVWMNEKSVPLTNKYDLAILVNPHTGTDLSNLGQVPILDTRGGY